MKKKDTNDKQREPAVELFDPFEHHFISQNGKNEFLKALEDGQHELLSGTGN